MPDNIKKKITSVSLDDDVYEWIKALAEKNSRSISGQVNHFLKLRKNG